MSIYMMTKKIQDLSASYIGRLARVFLAVVSLLGLAGSLHAKTSKTAKPVKGGQDSDLKAKQHIKEAEQEQESEIQQEIQEEMEEISEQEKQTEAATQKSRYSYVTLAGAYGSLFGTLGIVVSSLFFNVPLPLGAGLVALLPGEPHTVELSLKTDQETLAIDEEFDVDIEIDSGFAKPYSGHIEIDYDHSALEVQEIDYSSSFFPITLQNRYDNQTGLILIERARDKDELVKAKNDKLATIKFKTKAYLGETKIEIRKRLDHPGEGQKGSWVYGESEESNLISQVDSYDLEIIHQTNEQVIDNIYNLGEPVTIDGDLSDWGVEVLGYVGFSEQEKGNLIKYTDLVDGKSTGPEDMALNFKIGQQEGYLYFTGVLTDDSRAAGDYMKILYHGREEVLQLGRGDIGKEENIFFGELGGNTYLIEAKLTLPFSFGNEDDLNILIKDFDADEKASEYKFRHQYSISQVEHS